MRCDRCLLIACVTLCHACDTDKLVSGAATTSTSDSLSNGLAGADPGEHGFHAGVTVE